MIINAIKDGVGITGGGSGSKPPVLEELNVTDNGTYSPSDGVDGFNPVEVNVQPNLQTKAIEITANGTSTIEADSNYDGLESVNIEVNVPIPEFTTEELVATANGTYTPSTDGYSKVRVDVSEPVSKYVVPNGMKFGYSTNLNIEDFDIRNVTDMSSMFNSCSSLTSLDLSGWNVSNVTNMGRLFADCSGLASIDLSSWDVANVTSLSNLFYHCDKIKSINLTGWKTSKVSSMSQAFNYCYKIESLRLNGWDTSMMVNSSFLFSNCESLASLDISGWNMTKIDRAYNIMGMFDGCKVLTDLNMNGAILPKINLTNWGLDTCTALTVDSLVSVLNALQQLDEGTSYTCTIGSTNLNKLSDEQKAIATSKGWVLN